MAVPKEIILASGNAGKIREIADIFSSLGVTITPQDALGIESPEETGATFIENALLKARHAAQASGLPAIADDSGICVDALSGRPGVRSARYAGNNATDEENVDRLLEEMAGVSNDKRGGGFHCAAVMVFPDVLKEPLVTEAVWRGEILHSRSGTGGFGYDPVFLDKKTGKTGAQMSREEKNKVSHRGKAFRELRLQVRALAE
jgi:XTP/dITP diphosphohydrolase